MAVYNVSINESAFDLDTFSINESYVGVTKETQAIIDQLSIFRNKHMTQTRDIHFFDNAADMASINTDPELIKLNRMFEEEFGFETFCLYISASVSANAMTYPAPFTSSKKFRKSDLIKKSNGQIAYKKSAKAVFLMYINAGLILNNLYSDREVMAIILHEIGHNFSFFLTQSVWIQTSIQRILKYPVILIMLLSKMQSGDIATILDPLKLSDEGILIIDNLKKTIYADEGLRYAYNLITLVKSTAGHINEELSKLFLPVFGVQIIIQSLYNLAINPLNIFAGYTNEKLADNFATVYGLGNELSTALVKFGRISDDALLSSKVISKVAPINWMYDLLTIPVMAVAYTADPHPTDAARLNNQIKYMEAELNKMNIDPKMKKEMELALVELRKTEMDFKQVHSVSSAIKDVYNIMILDLFGGDIREVLHKKKDSRYNAKYDKLVSNIDII